jgi:16S rRNA (guanine527-N7)-methyltransferase
VDQPQELLRICRNNGLLIGPGQINLLQQYVELLDDWNRRVNLISRRDMQNIWSSHILHSLAPWFHLYLPARSEVLDMGSGGGLPGVPLAILRSDLMVTLLDSTQKKTRALTDITSQLGLSNVNVLTGRAEEVGRREGDTLRFTAVLARAVAPLVKLIQWAELFLVKDSDRTVVPDAHEMIAQGRRLLAAPCLLAWKGGDLENELRVAAKRFRNANIQLLDLDFREGHKLSLDEKRIVLVRIG